MVGRLVENDEMRPGKRGKPEQQPGLLPAGKLSHRGVGGLAGKAEPAELGADARFRRLRHAPAHMRVGTAGAVELIELVLREQLEPGLRLARFRRLGPEAIDERHDAAPLRLAFFGKLAIERLALLALALEGRIAAAIEREPPALEMQDVIDRLIE